MCIKGERFGGALDGAAVQFSKAYDSGLIPMEFVNETRKQHKLIMGIGHRVKSVSDSFVCYDILLLITQLNNPDMRVVIIKDFVKAHFPATTLLDYALEVEKITTSKVRSLIYILHIECIYIET